VLYERNYEKNCVAFIIYLRASPLLCVSFLRAVLAKILDDVICIKKKEITITETGK